MIAGRLFRASPRDGLVLGAALIHGAAVPVGLALAATSGAAGRAAVVVLLALGMCWGSNTVSHIHLHAPLFRAEAGNRAFSLYLTVLLAVPQRWWRLRHLVHHGLGSGERLGLAGWSELGGLAAALAAFAALAPELLLTVHLPGVLLGLGLCAIQGRQEHARSDAGVDHHGRLYNQVWFNDGFHAAHHRAPGAHWTSLPARADAGDLASPLPPIARWLDRVPELLNHLAAGMLDRLEAATLGSTLVRSFLLRTHRRAWVALLAPIDRARLREVTIVGGGLFPRTALVLRELLPQARLTIVDAVPAHLERARAFLQGKPPPWPSQPSWSWPWSWPWSSDALPGRSFDDAATDARAGSGGADSGGSSLDQGQDQDRIQIGELRLVAGVYDGAAADLVVVPLAYRGDRARLYRRPPAPLVVVHDWLWRARGDRGVVVSPFLLKRLNAVGR